MNYMAFDSMSMEPGTSIDFLPPPGPPPFLKVEQFTHLAAQGWLILPLPTNDASTFLQPTATATNTAPILASLHNSLRSLFPLLQSFFRLPHASKASAYPAKQGTEFGWYHIENEKEYLTLRCRSRNHYGTAKGSEVDLELELENAAAAVWADATKVMQRMLCDIGKRLCLDLGVWEDLLDGTLSLPASEKEMSSGTLLRLFQYEANRGFAGVHTDLGLLTLCVGNRQGLQVLDRHRAEQGGGEMWIDIEAGEMVMLVGQTVKALTEGRVRAGVHRVVASEEARESVVFALRHSWTHDVDLARFGGEGMVEPRRLWETLDIGWVNVNAGRERRERQQKRLDRLDGKGEEEKGQG